jgi:hypothetical protein
MVGKHAGQKATRLLNGPEAHRFLADPLVSTQSSKPGRCRWSRAGLWAWLDLNQRPHPYQRWTAERHASQPLRWSGHSVSHKDGVNRSPAPARVYCPLASWRRTHEASHKRTEDGKHARELGRDADVNAETLLQRGPSSTPRPACRHQVSGRRRRRAGVPGCAR